MQPEVITLMMDRIRSLEDRLAVFERTESASVTTGTFAPIFLGTTIAGTFTYTQQNGWYLKRNDVVWVHIDVGISAISVAPTGVMRIGTLPFGVSASFTMSMVSISNLVYPAGALEIIVSQSGTSTQIALAHTRTNNTAVAYPAASFTNANTRLILGGFYRTA